MAAKEVPTIHYFDQDFVDIYNKTWAMSKDFWIKDTKNNHFPSPYFTYPGRETVNQFEACFATFFLVYSNKKYPTENLLDLFYNQQEESGAIRGIYDRTAGKPVFTDKNPEGLLPPLFSWAEFNLYHKVGNKKRIKEIVPILVNYYQWLENAFMDESGLYSVPQEATMMGNSPRKDLYFPIDFNSQQAINALYLSALADILNDKELSFRFKRRYFSLKTRINRLMWNAEDGIYYDLDKKNNQIQVKTIASFWPLLAEILNEDQATALISHLSNPDTFGTDNPFPTLAANEPDFCATGNGYCGSVFTPYTFMVIKGLEKYEHYELARECSLRHLYYIIDAFHPEDKTKGSLWEAYCPAQEKPATWKDKEAFPASDFISYTGLASIALMIENIVGLFISLPRKTVDWIIPTLEMMGIEELSLKRNMITILSKKSSRGWEIRLESEKLYYFTINILGQKKKRLPIPSGKCSMLVEKL